MKSTINVGIIGTGRIGKLHEQRDDIFARERLLHGLVRRSGVGDLLGTSEPVGIDRLQEFERRRRTAVTRRQHEAQLVRILRAAGVGARRVPLSGALPDDHGDGDDHRSTV